jgi:hypothetical protein
MLLLALIAGAQSARRQKPEKGPRALGLVELAPNGKAHLIPVVIMYDGEFYDASAYKAAPVPMALYSGTVYEAERTGASQGLFTVTGALESQNHTWSGVGTWLPAGTKSPSAGHKAESKPRDLEQEDAPPVLRHAEPKTAAPQSTPEAPSPTPAPAPTAPTATAPPTSNPAPTSAPAPATPGASAPASPVPASPAPASPAPASPDEPDATGPVLRRGKPVPVPKETASATRAAPPKSPATAKSTAATPPPKNSTGAIQLLPAISDAGGPDPRPYTFEMKPDEEQQLRQKMLTMAADEIRARIQKLTGGTAGGPAATRSSRAKSAPKVAQPSFEQVQFRAFDLSSSNEPVLVLMAQARMPAAQGQSSPDLVYMITLVAKEDIYGDLHKAFSNVTDGQHLDVLPRYELIDAVDADGDGRGELLFRKVSDEGSAFAVYRVIGEQVWPLFEGAMGP